MTTLHILIPHFNDPSGFALSLDSIAEQTWDGDREILVCDDGSSTANLTRLEAIADQSRERIQIIRNRVNRGRPYARNLLLEAAQADYSAWLDTGDEWYPEKLTYQFAGLERADQRGFDHPVWCTCNYAWQWSGGKRRPRKQKVSGDQTGNLLVGTLGGYLWTLLAPTQAFKNVGYFDLNLPRLQDLDFFLRFVTKGGRLILPPTTEPLCVYHKSDIGRRGREVRACFRYLHDKHTALLIKRSRRFRRQRRYEVHMHAARFTANNDEYMRTAAYLSAAAVLNPVAFTKKMMRDRRL